MMRGAKQQQQRYQNMYELRLKIIGINVYAVLTPEAEAKQFNLKFNFNYYISSNYFDIWFSKRVKHWPKIGMLWRN